MTDIEKEFTLKDQLDAIKWARKFVREYYANKHRNGGSIGTAATMRAKHIKALLHMASWEYDRRMEGHTREIDTQQ